MDNVWNMAEDRQLKNRVAYTVFTILTLVVIVLALYFKEYESFLLALPTFFVLMAITVRGRYLFIPPALVVFTIVMMFLIQLARIEAGDYDFLEVVADFLMGIFMGQIGLISVYVMLRAMPGFDSERSLFVTLTAANIGFSLATIIVMGNYGLTSVLHEAYSGDLRDVVLQLIVVLVGITFQSLLFFLNRHNGLFEHTLNRFLKENSSNFGIDEQERRRTLEEIAAGESSRCEFKSTLRTNLETGEKDPRMEKAVLKTIVAFLNSRGGTLFIGVADDGSIIGIDEASFDSRDRMNLHMNNLIVSQIGSEYLPYINYRLIDFDDKAVMRVTCKRSNTPVFLKEGKVMTFFVRSGPSSIVLEGMQLLYYASHNFPKLPKNSAGDLLDLIRD